MIHRRESEKQGVRYPTWVRENAHHTYRLGQHHAIKPIKIVGIPTPKPTPSAILSLVLRPEKTPPLLVLAGGEEVVIVELGVEVVETVPC